MKPSARTVPLSLTSLRLPSAGAAALLAGGGIAQLVERLLCKQQVAGSTPAASTTPAGLVAQLVRARP